MVDKTERPRKAAVGSSDRYGNSVSRGRSRHQKERPQAPSRTPEVYRDADEYGEEEEHMQNGKHCTPVLRTPRLVELPQEEQKQKERPRTGAKHTTAKHTTKPDADLGDESADSSDDWEQIPREVYVQNYTSTSISPTLTTPPSYPFPGTWPAALQETTSAFSQVTLATKSYASALTSSGFGKASWSIGAAALSSTNKYALSLTSWGLLKTGLMPGELPARVKKWVRHNDEAKRRVELKMMKKKRRRGMGEPLTFGDERGAFVLDMHETDSMGEFTGPVPRSMLGGNAPRSRAGEYEGGEEEDNEEEDNEEEDNEEEDNGEEDNEEEDNEEGEEGEEYGSDDGLLRVFEFD
ncbi:hypothetical protein EJ02DRAFT_454051, partial [Clathrospora elynae]